jgi:hypothetical protein
MNNRGRYNQNISASHLFSPIIRLSYYLPAYPPKMNRVVFFKDISCFNNNQSKDKINIS